MAFFDWPWITLSEEGMRLFNEQMRNPDREAARRRDAFLEEIHQNPWRENEDGSYEIEFDLKPVTAQEIFSDEFTSVMQFERVHFEASAYDDEVTEAEMDEAYNYAA